MSSRGAGIGAAPNRAHTRRRRLSATWSAIEISEVEISEVEVEISEVEIEISEVEVE